MSERDDQFVNPIVDILCAEEEPPEWLIKDILVQGAFTTLIGESGAGKSYVSYTLGLAVAAGVPALSGIVPKAEPKRVLYFDDENSRQDRDKYLRRAWLGLKALNGGKEPDLGLLLENFWPVGFALGGDDWADKAEEWIVGLRPHLIVFDTANACTNVDDENSNAEATRAIKAMKRLMRINEDQGVIASTLALKHAKTRTEKGQIRTVRGAKVWKDMSDSVLFQVKLGGRPRKDGLSGTRLVPDKVRAYGLQQPIYIDPVWTDKARNGLQLNGSYKASNEHTRDEAKDDEE